MECVREGPEGSDGGGEPYILIVVIRKCCRLMKQLSTCLVVEKVNCKRTISSQKPAR